MGKSEVVFAICVALIAADATADVENSPVATKRSCIEQQHQEAAALAAKDWSQLERQANRFLEKCRGVLDTERDSNSYGFIAIASLQTGNPQKALSASESCIDIKYSNSLCHLQRVKALVALKRTSEARTELGVSERIIAHNTEVAKLELANASTSLNKQLAESSLYSLKSQQEWAASLRTDLSGE